MCVEWVEEKQTGSLDALYALHPMVMDCASVPALSAASNGRACLLQRPRGALLRGCQRRERLLLPPQLLRRQGCHVLRLHKLGLCMQ